MKYCQLTQCWYTVYKYVHTIFQPADFLRLILLFIKYVTQVWLAWRQAEPFWLIAELAQSSTKFSLLKLCLRAFSAKSSPRSCLMDWPRCSLLGQLPARVFSLCLARLTGRDLLDEAWLSRRSQLNICSPYRSWILPSSLGVHISQRRCFSLTSLGPNMKLSILYQASEAVSPEGSHIA